MMCFAPIAHHVLNRSVWQNLKPAVQNNLKPYKKLLLEAKDSTNEAGMPNPDDYDVAENKKDPVNYPIGHLTLKVCKDRADKYIEYAKINYDKEWYKSAAYRLGYAMHYIQDMACPVHVLGLTGEKTWPEYGGKTGKTVHQDYENSWAAKYGFSCASIDTCATYDDIKGLAPDEETRLKTTLGVGSDLGTVFERPNVREYLKNRVNVWYPYYKANNTTQIKNNLKQDLAMAICIQKRYIKDKISSWIA